MAGSQARRKYQLTLTVDATRLIPETQLSGNDLPSRGLASAFSVHGRTFHANRLIIKLFLARRSSSLFAKRSSQEQAECCQLDRSFAAHSGGTTLGHKLKSWQFKIEKFENVWCIFHMSVNHATQARNQMGSILGPGLNHSTVYSLKKTKLFVKKYYTANFVNTISTSEILDASRSQRGSSQ